MSYIKHLPTEMIQAKYDEYKGLYEKFERLYTTMRKSRNQYTMNEIDYHKKLGYYRNMSGIYKKQMYDCRMFLLNRWS
jgi:hypothetical protein